MAEQNKGNERQRELFIRKSARVVASYLKRAKELSEIPYAAKFLRLPMMIYRRLRLMLTGCV